MLFKATVQSVSGPLSICVTIDLEDATLAKVVMIDEVCVRDVDSCMDWLEENLIGETVYCYVKRVAKSNIYICDVKWNDEDVGRALIDEGLVD